MQKVYLLNVTLTVLILTLSFFTGTLLAQTTGSVFHRAEEIKPGTMGSEVGVNPDNSSYDFPNIYVTNQVTAGTIKVGATEFDSDSGYIGGSLTVTGNVGIGTTSPAYKLDVSGMARFTQPVIIGYPYANDHAATKGYVDAQAGGSNVTWLGYTAETTGSIGGTRGINQKCDYAFPGAHACTYNDIINLGVNYPYTYNAWIIDGSYYSDGWELTKDGFAFAATQLPEPMCRGWSSSYYDNFGAVLSTGGNLFLGGCNTSYRVPCCK